MILFPTHGASGIQLPGRYVLFLSPHGEPLLKNLVCTYPQESGPLNAVGVMKCLFISFYLKILQHWKYFPEQRRRN